MPRVSSCNVPKVALRWSIERAGHEFGLASHTLRKALAKASEIAGPDGCYGTKQIVAATHGSMEVEKLATQREIRRKLELENEITTGSFVNKDAIMAGLGQVAAAMVSIIATSGLSKDAQESLQRELAGIEIVVEDAACAQTKLPRRSRNGQTPENEASES
jgi:hypothetical protein